MDRAKREQSGDNPVGARGKAPWMDSDERDGQTICSSAPLVS